MSRTHLTALTLLALAGLTSLTGCADYSMGGSAEFGATQGGVQDMGLAREMIADGYVPPTEAFLVEGMFSEHDLPLTGDACTTLLCLRGAAGIAPDRMGTSAGWLQVGMSSTINPETFERPSQTIVATVDVSGSMGWGYEEFGEDYDTPGTISHHLLHAIVDELGPEDRLAIVTFGSRVRTPLGFTDPTRDRVRDAIDDLDEAGSTNMEEGLERAYRLATGADFGTDEVRVMLFTDVQPNVGATEPSEFEQMASDAATEGVGTTVYAMGVGMGQEVTASMSHLHGGNAFSLFSTEDADELMDDSWPWMVSPIAYDLVVRLDRPEGFTLNNAYGFPKGDDGEAKSSLDVATVFLSRRKGAMLLELAPDASYSMADLALDGELSYTTTDGSAVQQDLSVSWADSQLDDRGHWYEQHSVGRTTSLALLVDGMRDAAELYGTDPEAAVEIMSTAATRFDEDAAVLADDDLTAETLLAADLLQLMSDGAEQRDSLYGY